MAPQMVVPVSRSCPKIKWFKNGMPPCGPFYSRRVIFAKALLSLPSKFETIVYDCKSLFQAGNIPYPSGPVIITLQETSVDLAINKQLLVMWVPGHHNLPGNELADTQATLGYSTIQPGDATPSSAENATQPLRRPWLKQVYTTGSNEKLETYMFQADITDIIRFRSGHHPSLHRWHHLMEERRNTTQSMWRGGRDSRASLPMVSCSPGGPQSPPSKRLNRRACPPPYQKPV